jgi:hypothetical protein
VQRYAAFQQIGNMEMPEAVKFSRRQSCLSKFLREGVAEHNRVQRLAIWHGEHQVCRVPPKAEPEPHNSLLFLVTGKLG